MTNVPRIPSEQRRDRLLFWISILWAVSLCGYFVAAPDLVELLWLAVLPLIGGLLISGVAILTIGVVHARRTRKWISVPAAIALAGLVVFFTCGYSSREQVRFWIVRSHYENRLKEVQAILANGGKPADCQVDQGPPVRVAFYWQRGVIDNWVGLVYDPTAEVMKANGFKRDWSNWGDPRLKTVKGLFGGDLLRAKRVGKDWYLCWFT